MSEIVISVVAGTIIAMAIYGSAKMATDWANKDECQHAHNVYRCEKIEQWVPAAWTPEETK